MKDKKTPKEDEWFLPPELLSEEKLAESKQIQEELAARINSPYANKTAQDVSRFQASIIIRDTEPIVEALGLDGLSEIKREYLAESYAEIGDYKRACETTQSEAKKSEWKAIYTAVWRDDEETCSCGHQSSGGKRVNNKFVKAEIFSPKHRKIMPLVACSNPDCTHLNVRVLPASISKERAIRQEAIAAVSGKPPADAKIILQNKGISSANIIK